MNTQYADPWETEEEILRSMGGGQYEDYTIVSKDEADRRIAQLEAENKRLKTLVPLAEVAKDGRIAQLEAELAEAKNLLSEASDMLAMPAPEWEKRRAALEGGEG